MGFHRETGGVVVCVVSIEKAFPFHRWALSQIQSRRQYAVHERAPVEALHEAHPEA
jgi:hypothetical protein